MDQGFVNVVFYGQQKNMVDFDFGIYVMDISESIQDDFEFRKEGILFSFLFSRL